MKNVLLLLSVVFFVTGGAVSQVISYDATAVPPELKKNASVIKRFEDVQFEITDIDRAVVRRHEVYTIFGEEGKSALTFSESTDKFRTLGDVDIKVYDEKGKSVQKFKRKDLATTISWDGLIDDAKIFYLHVPVTSYPLTVEYIYEVKYKGTLFYPAYIIRSSGESVEYSSFTARVPKELDLRYQEKNINLNPEMADDGKYKTYKWTAKSQMPVENEEGSGDWVQRKYPYILLAPSRFKMDDYEGDMTTWKNFGQWMNALYKGLDELPADRKQFFNDMVKDIPDTRGKIRAIYSYLQKNFRYVSIQLGIGGWKPFSADFTDKKKYGDCKALSNYMKAALKAVNINSFPAIINSGYDSGPVDSAFPSNYGFNHVILCVPLDKDTVWLECTSNDADFNKLGTSTENRKAMLLTENGGALVSTPGSRASDNRSIMHTLIELNEDGSGKTTTLFKSVGFYRQVMDQILDAKKDDQKNAIVNYIGFKQPDEFILSKKDPADVFTTSLDMSIEKIPEFKAGNKMFICPRPYKLWTNKLPKAENRSTDYFFHHPFDRTDTTVINLPPGYTSEVLPKNKSLSCAFATYATSYWFDKDQKAIYSTTRFVLKQHRIPASDYADVKKFFDEVLLDDSQRIIVKKE